ncbi:MAG: sigma-54-dependent Fis family transcriptional regulator [Deltaproteobacteria bacterium HGW-Deltaproteobacteria-18]|jgi:DNA-binding NtrC family response regulator|nr:MAG: sigma-54-dependent Fis family transcriptional regulator [Deltaproteobacteria bacterium HGW-Deltaproteobacteria-18]
MIYEKKFLNTLISLCDDLAWGRPASEEQLFDLTRPGAGPEDYVRLAEAFGMMLVKVEGREFHRDELISELKARNAELEETRALLAQRNRHLMQTVQDAYQPRRIIGSSEGMRRVVELALSIARRPINTVILGPTGAGKEVVAKMVHYNSPRREGPFVAVNCSAIPENLFESEMFGIEKGAASGVGFRRGLVEEASGGTLFLDEVGEMSLAHQAKFLRVLEEQEVQRVGRNKPLPVDIKVIAATNASLEEAVREGRFRSDLYYRISVAEIRLPPLCERGDDILLLAQHFLEEHCARMGRHRLILAAGTREALLAYSWPGNVRELGNEMERAASLTVGDRVEAADLSSRITATVPRRVAVTSLTANISAAENPACGAVAFSDNDPAPAQGPFEKGTADLNLQLVERWVVTEALNRCAGNKTRAAELLGITREGLRKKLQRIGMTEQP